MEADPKLVQDPQKAEILQNLKKELEKNPQDIASLANAVRGAWQYLSAMFFGKEWNAKTEL